MSIRPRLFGLVGFQSFTASDSFSAVLDSSSGVVFGGGGGVLLGRNLFVDVSISRFAADGTRVFVTDGGEIVDLGIATEVDGDADRRVDRLALGGPARRSRRPASPAFGRCRSPAAASASSSTRRRRSSSSAEDDVNESHGSYHVLGGIELPFSPHLGAIADVLYRWVPDAIGTGGVSAHYDETDLGGAQVRVRVVFTF